MIFSTILNSDTESGIQETTISTHILEVWMDLDDILDESLYCRFATNYSQF